MEEEGRGSPDSSKREISLSTKQEPPHTGVEEAKKSDRRPVAEPEKCEPKRSDCGPLTKNSDRRPVEEAKKCDRRHQKTDCRRVEERIGQDCEPKRSDCGPLTKKSDRPKTDRRRVEERKSDRPFPLPPFRFCPRRFPRPPPPPPLSGSKEKRNNYVVVDIDDPPWVKYTEATLSKYCQCSHPFTICKVPRDIREVDSVAHDPLVVSIGPYHRGNENLLDMEQVKWRNLNAFRGRFNKLWKAMKEIEEQARDCYSGKINMNTDEFIEMMLLDGLFMIELFSRGNILNEPIYTISGMLRRVGRDMLLLENQLPFFVLERLWNVGFTSKFDRFTSKFDLWSSACTFIHNCLPFSLLCDPDVWDKKLLRVHEENKKKRKKKKEDRVHHLLHLVYLLLKPTSQTITKKSEPTESKPPGFIKNMKTLSFLPPRCRDAPMGPLDTSLLWDPTAPWEPGLPPGVCSTPLKKMKTLSFLPSRCHDCFRSPSSRESQSTECTAKLPVVIKQILPFLSPSKSEDEKPRPLEVIPSAVELHEAGVVFKCVKAKSFLDVKFEKGTMKMPRLSVEDSTKPLLRNFIAYERCFPNQGDHITSYCTFMDLLVNTPRDVEILKGSAIVENWLGSDKEVAILFNDLCKGTFSDLEESYLGKSFKDVMEHTQKTWPKWRARLMHDYFSNPWTIIYLIAATFGIFLTSVQTYYAAFT